MASGKDRESRDAPGDGEGKNGGDVCEAVYEIAASPKGEKQYENWAATESLRVTMVMVD